MHEFEKNNGFKYDVVMRGRTDIIFNKKKFVGKTTLGNNSEEKNLVLFGLYDDGILVTINNKSTKKTMTSEQMVDLAIGLLERSRNPHLSKEKSSN